MLILFALSLTSCTQFKENASGSLKKIGGVCPPSDERTFKDILCREPK